MGLVSEALPSDIGAGAHLNKVHSLDLMTSEAECTWCRSAAVPPTFYTKEEVVGFPPAVFDCSSEALSAKADVCN